MMRSIIYLCILALIFITAQATDIKKVVILADQNYPPYSFVNSKNELDGIYTNILKKADQIFQLIIMDLRLE